MAHRNVLSVSCYIRFTYIGITYNIANFFSKIDFAEREFAMLYVCKTETTHAAVVKNIVRVLSLIVYKIC